MHSKNIKMWALLNMRSIFIDRDTKVCKRILSWILCNFASMQIHYYQNKEAVTPKIFDVKKPLQLPLSHPGLL